MISRVRGRIGEAVKVRGHKAGGCDECGGAIAPGSGSIVTDCGDKVVICPTCKARLSRRETSSGYL